MRPEKLVEKNYGNWKPKDSHTHTTFGIITFLYNLEWNQTKRTTGAECSWFLRRKQRSTRKQTFCFRLSVCFVHFFISMLFVAALSIFSTYTITSDQLLRIADPAGVHRIRCVRFPSLPPLILTHSFAVSIYFRLSNFSHTLVLFLSSLQVNPRAWNISVEFIITTCGFYISRISLIHSTERYTGTNKSFYKKPCFRFRTVLTTWCVRLWILRKSRV